MLRSLAQHRYEWACYRVMAAETGNTAYYMYQFFAKRFLREIDEQGNPVYRKPSSLEDWEHTLYMHQVNHFFAAFFPEFIWPDPDEFHPVFKPFNTI